MSDTNFTMYWAILFNFNFLECLQIINEYRYRPAIKMFECPKPFTSRKYVN